jgi:hypothetical protein
MYVDFIRRMGLADRSLFPGTHLVHHPDRLVRHFLGLEESREQRQKGKEEK